MNVRRHRIGLAIAAAAAVVAGCLVQTGASSASRSSSSSQLSLITEPAAGIGPIVSAIAHARTSVELVMYELQDSRVEGALAAAEHRGVHVRVLLNRGYYGESTDDGRPAFNLPAYDYLQRHGVPVHWSPSRFALTHEKALVVDGQTAYILTFNFTARYYSTSRDFGVVDRSARDVSAIDATFDADWTGARSTPSTGIDLVWSPGAESEQVSFIDHARTSLDVENEEMDEPEVEAALEAAARRGVDVRVVMTDSSEWTDAFAALERAGVTVRTYSEDAPLYIHAKLMVTPSQTFVGSQNFSYTSLQANRELGITLSVPTIVRSLTTTFNSDFAGARAFTG